VDGKINSQKDNGSDLGESWPCGQETSDEARRTDMTHVAVEFTTPCEHVQRLAEVLKTKDV